MKNVTERPWKIVRKHNGYGIVGGRSPDPVTEARNLIIATVHTPPEDPAYPLWDHIKPEEAQANAVLMKCAPDLYENLERLVFMIEDDPNYDQESKAIESAVQVLREARGEI